MIETIGVWIAAFLTLCILSFLYKENPFYKLAESDLALVYYSSNTLPSMRQKHQQRDVQQIYRRVFLYKES